MSNKNLKQNFIPAVVFDTVPAQATEECRPIPAVVFDTVPAQATEESRLAPAFDTVPAQATEESRLAPAPAITCAPKLELRSRITQALPEQEVIFVDEQETTIIQMADNIEKKCYRKAMATCTEEMRPAVYEVNGETERERAILNIANSLPNKYQKKYKLRHPPVLLPSPHPPHIAHSNIKTCVDEREKNTMRSVAPNHLGTHIYNDMELAQLFIHRVFIRRRGQQLYVFNGKYYQALTENELHTMILQYLRQEINTAGRASTIRSVAKAIHAEPDIIVKESEVDSSKICLLDGILDTKTLQLEPHTSRYFINWQLNSSWVSNGLDSNCPYFDRYLHDVTGGDPVLLLRFWQATGYLLIGEGNIAKRVFILTGPSDAGKSVYGSLLREFHHPEQISSIDAFKLGDRFSASSLVNARLNLSMDLPHGSLPEQAVGMIKKISGSDSVTVEVKYRTPYTTELDCKLVFATNHPIRASVADRALARRLMILPFQYSIPKSQQDRYLLNKLLKERPAILQRAVMAYYKLKANNYVFAGDDRFNNDVIMGITGDSAMTADAVEQFANARCIKAPGQFTSTEQLHEAYNAFCQRIGSSCIQDRQQFSTRVHPILERKFQAIRKKIRVEGVPRNGYWGVQLVPGEP